MKLVVDRFQKPGKRGRIVYGFKAQLMCEGKERQLLEQYAIQLPDVFTSVNRLLNGVEEEFTNTEAAYKQEKHHLQSAEQVAIHLSNQFEYQGRHLFDLLDGPIGGSAPSGDQPPPPTG